MNADLLGIAGVFAKAGFGIVGRIVLLTLGGTVLSWLLALNLFDELRSMWTWNEEGSPVLHGTPPFLAAVIITGGMLVQNYRATLLGAAFVVGFPALWYILGMRYALKKGLNRVYRERGEAAIEFFLQQLIAASERLPPQVGAQASAGMENAAAVAQRIVRTIAQDAPFPVRNIVRFFFRRFEKQQIAVLCLSVVKQNNGTSIRERVAAQLKLHADGIFARPGRGPLLALLAVELTAYAAATLLI